ncbi:MAG: hypothetical protein Q4B13_05385 [Lautropia sp.]|nr:hypothetical protein [Lautropia sp.]
MGGLWRFCVVVMRVPEALLGEAGFVRRVIAGRVLARFLWQARAWMAD